MTQDQAGMREEFRKLIVSPASAYVIPFVLYLLGTSFIARFSEASFALAYAIVTILVGSVTFALLRGKQLFRIHGSIFLGVACGLIGIWLWIFISQLQLEKQLASFLPEFMQPQDRVGYNPFEHLGNGWKTWTFIAFRLLGIAVIVPVAEELFWRGFLLRWLIDPEWERVPIGTFTWTSCGIVTLMFTLAHPEWLAAATYCLLVNGLLYWRKDLWQCIVAHATSNLALAIYVLTTNSWWLW